MKKITFEANYQIETNIGDLVNIDGGGDMYQLYIENYYRGQFTYKDNTWVFLPQNPDEFTIDDIQILIDKLNTGDASRIIL